jgi:hypothetical protein
MRANLIKKSLLFTGGTVDVTCYEVKGESHLSELESPTGGPWGGIIVDEEFCLLFCSCGHVTELTLVYIYC